MIEAGRECGLDVCRYAVSPDGTIHITEERAQPQMLTDFDRLEAIL
ncbi:hypothetical protein [Sphingopyxis sp. QXT-31]|nr:hypothetical protein [Sphingopyxis sp. QXT-31]